MKTAIAVVGLCVAVTGHALAQTNQNAPVKPWELYQKPAAQPPKTETPAKIDFQPDDFAKTNQLILGTPPTVSLTLSNGVVLKIIKIVSLEPDGINVTYIHKSLAESQMGFVDHVKIPFELLSKELQEKYNFNPASADAYRKMLADNAEAWRKIQEENEKIAAQKVERQKEELDLEIKIRTLQALEAQATAQQRQADAQERAAGAQEIQSLSQQQINSQLEDLNWQLMRLRQQEQGY